MTRSCNDSRSDIANASDTLQAASPLHRSREEIQGQRSGFAAQGPLAPSSLGFRV